MSSVKPLTSETLILDGDVLRHDWEGFPRFYVVRIYPHDPRECPAHPHLYTPRVKVHVQLEGDASAWHASVCDDSPDDINEAVFDCVTEIETLCWNRWEAEAWAERRDQVTRYERQFGV